MDAFAGFEPQVGEIRAVRSFRVGPDGTLYPLFSDQAWVDGTNTARCRVTPDDPDHAAPDPECTCGFYAYASARAADEYPHARHVLAVVACWGRVIAGSRGVRAEKARIEAVWMSPKVPEYLRHAVTARYPSAVVESDVDRLLEEHPPSELSCYDPQPPREPPARRVATRVAVGSLCSAAYCRSSGSAALAARTCCGVWRCSRSSPRPSSYGSGIETPWPADGCSFWARPPCGSSRHSRARRACSSCGCHCSN